MSSPVRRKPTEEGALLCGAWEDGSEEDSKSEEGLDDAGRVLDVPEDSRTVTAASGQSAAHGAYHQ